jgi:alpha-glucosidase
MRGGATNGLAGLNIDSAQEIMTVEEVHMTKANGVGPILLAGLLAAAAVAIGLKGACMPLGKQTHSVRSPDERIEVKFALIDGTPHYEVACAGKAVVMPSPMGFTFRGAEPLDGGFEVEDTSEREFRETWTPVWGQRSEIENHYQELTVRLKEQAAPHRLMNIVFRAFNDGVAFRYEFPGQDGLKDFEIMSEETRFALAGNHTTWWIPADFDSYEHLYKETPLDIVLAVNTPVTMKTEDGLYVSLHEADLTDYAGMTLSRVKGEAYTLKTTLVPWPDGSKVKGSTPFKTPWRTIHISTSPGGLVESSLILNLNRPCLIEDTSWIKPMKYIGIWWGLHIGKETWHEGPRHGATTENAKRYIDFASKHGIPGVLIEGWNTGWDRWGQEGAYDHVTPYADFDLEEVVRYAGDRRVAIIGHHETGGDVTTYDEQIEFAFRLYKKVGISAIKTGYAGKIFPRGQYHHGQWMVRHYRMVVEKAAKHGIMLDVHEPIKPTGISRTYPNMMTREGVRGTEYNAWSEGNPPEHVTILPFTRMLAGPLDYTPGIFDLTFEEFKPHNRVHSTLASQLALYVILYSPLQMAADLIENYENHPAFDFIKEVPVDWDETKVVNGEIGDYVTIARRRGDSWYVGSVTDENARALTVDLSFLKAGRTYRARIYSDAPESDFETNPAAYRISEQQVTRDTILSAELARGGGQAIILQPSD